MLAPRPRSTKGTAVTGETSESDSIEPVDRGGFTIQGLTLCLCDVYHAMSVDPLRGPTPGEIMKNPARGFTRSVLAWIVGWVLAVAAVSAGAAVPLTTGGVPTGPGSIAAGGSHSCAITDIGTVKCWGFNFSGQLGNGSFNDSGIAVTVNGIFGVVAIASRSWTMEK
jgi:hypothetical protein